GRSVRQSTLWTGALRRPCGADEDLIHVREQAAERRIRRTERPRASALDEGRAERGEEGVDEFPFHTWHDQERCHTERGAPELEADARIFEQIMRPGGDTVAVLAVHAEPAQSRIRRILEREGEVRLHRCLEAVRF